MQITAIAPWFGSKRTLAPRIVKAIGMHRSYWEPFCGSFAVILEKERARQETVNDLHGGAVNLARVLASDDAPKLYERLSRTLFAEGLLEDAKRLEGHGLLGKLAPLDHAYWFFVQSWMGRNGTSGTSLASNQSFCKRYTGKGGTSSTRFRNAVESIPAWHERLRGVEIWSMDAFDLIPKIEDAEGVAIYCDPPYIVKGAKYLHDFAPADHARLAVQLQRFRFSRVVVSYYEHTDLDRLYPGWTKLPCSVAKSLVNQGRRDQSGGAVAPEVLLINDTAAQGGLDFTTTEEPS